MICEHNVFITVVRNSCTHAPRHACMHACMHDLICTKVCRCACIHACMYVLQYYGMHVCNTKIQTRVTSRVATELASAPSNELLRLNQKRMQTDYYSINPLVYERNLARAMSNRRRFDNKGPPRVLNVILRWRTFLKQSSKRPKSTRLKASLDSVRASVLELQVVDL
jgi:hypothetical protein